MFFFAERFALLAVGPVMLTHGLQAAQLLGVKTLSFGRNAAPRVLAPVSVPPRRAVLPGAVGVVGLKFRWSHSSECKGDVAKVMGRGNRRAGLERRLPLLRAGGDRERAAALGSCLKP